MIRKSDHLSYRHTILMLDQLFKAIIITKIRHGHWIGDTLEIITDLDFALMLI